MIAEIALPPLQELLANATLLEQREGRLNNHILKLIDPYYGPCFLNIASGYGRYELDGEYDFLQEYYESLPVPEVYAYCREGADSYLLTSTIEGEPLHTVIDEFSSSQIIDLVGEALDLIANQPLIPGTSDALELELQEVERIIRQGEIDRDSFLQNTGRSPEAELEAIRAEQFFHRDDVLSHGDFCLPNLMVKDGELSGIIDWGKAGRGDIYRDLAALEGSMRRNVGQDGMKEFFTILDMDYADFRPAKIQYYNRIDQFWNHYQEV